jgi:hypothetical protein
LTSNPWFTATSVATAATLVFLLIRVHDAIHFPGVSHFIILTIGRTRTSCSRLEIS